MHRVLASFALILGVLASGPSRAEYYINDSWGGSIEEFRAELGPIARSKERVHVEGRCYSACTVILSLPRSRICIGPRTEFGFHAAFDVIGGVKKTSAQGTMELIGLYQRPIFDWIVEHGGLTPHAIVLTGAPLRKLFPRCSAHLPPGAVQAFAEPTRRGLIAAQRLAIIGAAQ